MGAVGEPGAPGNQWREATDWPPPAKPTSLYLSQNGGLSQRAPVESQGGTSYESDPLKPMSIPGRGFPGARDARAFEEQGEVRVWTTEPLDAPLEITGQIEAEIWLRATVKDTDVVLRVSDVYPDGRSILLMDYPLRARYREGFERQVLLTPGVPARLRWHIGWTSIVLNKGHRLRVAVTSTGAPLYEPNSQTGGPQTRDWLNETQKGTVTILHEREHPSRLLLPVP
jgi:putative CocE/NonD family hydrolase